MVTGTDWLSVPVFAPSARSGPRAEEPSRDVAVGDGTITSGTDKGLTRYENERESVLSSWRDRTVSCPSSSLGSVRAHGTEGCHRRKPVL
jgi:hypothetical protein